MIEVTEELTRQIAHLARLSLSEDEVKLFTPQLSEILRYVERLQEVDVQNCLPMTHPFEGEGVLPGTRPDTLDSPHPRANADEPYLGQKSQVLGLAPEVFNDHFKVPSIL